MKNYHTIIGHVFNYIISASLIISGILKLAGVKPYHEMITDLSPFYYSNIHLLGIIAIISGILFVIPKTFILGFIASLVFFGGTISAHMQHGDIYIPQLVFALLTALTAYLKHPTWFRNT